VVEQPAFISGYEVLAELGRGTTGVVYQARHVALNHRLVTLKLPLSSAGAEERLRNAYFRREAQALAILTSSSDPGFPNLYGAGEYEGRPYLVREFIEGQTLEQMAVGGTLDRREAFVLLAAVAMAVERVHAKGFAHRNVHPSNILVATNDTPKLVGFGRVGILAGSDFLAPGSTGVAAEVDVRALQEMVVWLCGHLRGLRPEELRDTASVRTARAFAECLNIRLQQR
jgi:eukaryotic-like serine/threonine-protein kinase